MPSDLGELTVDEIYQGDFQTKDLSSGMDHYTIYGDGSIGEEVYSDGPGAVEVRVVRKPQLINFYTSFDKESNDYWVEYQYSFNAESEIKLVKFEVEPNAERKAREKEFWDAQNERTVLLNKWYMRPYIWYARGIRFMFRKYRWLGQKLPDAWKVERFLTPL
jgi:hypothetical protein